MTIESGVFLCLLALTLVLNRWLNGKEIEAAKATFRQDALNSALEVAKEREALAELAKDAAQAELDALKRQKDNRSAIERNALPFFTTTDKEQAQMDKMMHDKGEEFLAGQAYSDEVPGLGR